MFRFIGFYDYTVILTYMSLLSAVIGMNRAANGSFSAAVACLFICGILDAFDGTVARSKKDRTDDEKAFGIQIDSLCDAVAFGVFPAVLCYHMGNGRTVGILCLFTYVLCAVIRLAFFNVIESKRQQVEDGCNKYYRGLPVTTISIIFPIVYVFSFFLSEAAFAALSHAVLLITALFFVLDISVKKPDWYALLFRGKAEKKAETNIR